MEVHCLHLVSLVVQMESFGEGEGDPVDGGTTVVGDSQFQSDATLLEQFVVLYECIKVDKLSPMTLVNKLLK